MHRCEFFGVREHRPSLNFDSLFIVLQISPSTRRNLLPGWQVFPVINYPGTPIYNWDYLSALYTDGVTTALDQHRVIISEAQLLPDLLNPDAVEEAHLWADWYSGFVQPGQPSEVPLSEIYFPIFDKLDSLHAPSWVQDDKE